jgi:hypothetical protein
MLSKERHQTVTGPVGDATFYKWRAKFGGMEVSDAKKLKDENEEIADLLVGLTDARKTWGFGLCFLHLRNVKGHPWILLPGNACLHA